MTPRCLHYLVPIVGIIAATTWLHRSDNTNKGTYVLDGIDSLLTQQNQTGGDDNRQFKLADGDSDPRRVAISNYPNLSFEVLS
jgi:hypothetical protein